MKAKEIAELWNQRPRYSYGDTRKWQPDTLQFLADVYDFHRKFGSVLEVFLNQKRIEELQGEEK